MAVPRGLDGHNNAAQHNRGDNNSIFTSWTRSKNVARKFGRRKGKGGVLLTKKFKKSRVVTSPDKFKEQEVLVPGIVTGQV